MPKTETASETPKCCTRRLKGPLGAESSGLLLRRHPDSNWGVEVLQTSALPLGYGAMINDAEQMAQGLADWLDLSIQPEREEHSLIILSLNLVASVLRSNTFGTLVYLRLDKDRPITCVSFSVNCLACGAITARSPAYNSGVAPVWFSYLSKFYASCPTH